MNDDVTQDLLRGMQDQADSAVRHRVGVVTALAPLSVDLGNSGTPFTAVKSLGSYAPMVGDVVSVLRFGNDLVIAGRIGNDTDRVVVSAAATADITLLSIDQLCSIEFTLESSALCELRLFPNAAVAPFNGAIYSNVRDGSFQTSAPASAAVAAAGQVNDANGVRLGYAPSGSVAGGQQMTGRCVFGTAVPVLGIRRTAITQTAVSSLLGSANHVIELENIASLVNSNAAITSLRFQVSSGTMTGIISVKHF